MTKPEIIEPLSENTVEMASRGREKLQKVAYILIRISKSLYHIGMHTLSDQLLQCAEEIIEGCDALYKAHSEEIHPACKASLISLVPERVLGCSLAGATTSVGS